MSTVALLFVLTWEFLVGILSPVKPNNGLKLPFIFCDALQAEVWDVGEFGREWKPLVDSFSSQFDVLRTLSTKDVGDEVVTSSEVDSSLSKSWELLEISGELFCKVSSWWFDVVSEKEIWCIPSFLSPFL